MKVVLKVSMSKRHEMFHHKHHRADNLQFFFDCNFFYFAKDGKIMLVSLTPGQVARATVAPTTKGNPSQATLSSIVFSSLDPTVFSVAPDPAVPNGCIITGVGSGTALSAGISATCTATEPDGTTTETISGSDTVSCTLGGGTTTSPADNLVFTLTSSVPNPPNPPNPPAAAAIRKL